MKVRAQEYTAELSPESIHECYRRTREFLSGLELPKKDILRHAMTVEENLLTRLRVSQYKKANKNTAPL